MHPDTAFEHLPLAAALVDCDGTVLSINRLFREHLQARGLGPEFVGRPAILYAASPEHEPQLRAFIHEMLTTDGMVRTEWQIPDSEDEAAVGRLWGHRIVEDGVVTGAVFIRDDVTTEIRNKKELSRTTTLFEALGAQLPDIVIFTDDRGEIIDCNDAAAVTLGYERIDLVGRPLAVLTPDPEGQRQRFQQALAAGVGQQGVVDLRRADGGELRVDSNVTVIEKDGERVMCLVLRDVTQRLQAERERESLQRLESLGVLAGGLAHDFNNLLAGISGRLSLASSYAGGVGELTRLLSEAETAVQQASRLTTQLLTFAKGGEPVKARVDLAAIVRSEAGFASAGSTTRLQYGIEDDLWAVTADVGQIRQVIQNLVINAIQAMEGGGSIEVGLRNVEVEAGDESAPQPGRYVELRVTDDGPGIPTEILDRIFEPYFSTQESSGLGLATLHSIVSRHDGVIAATSPPGSGATFHVRLPVADDEMPASGGEAPALEASTISDGSSLRLLVMDDDSSLRSLLQDLFDVLGHEADLAGHGEEALELCRTALDTGKPYDAVLLDLTIRGGMGGLETGQALLDLAPGLPIFLMSGYNEDGIAAEPEGLGFAGYVAKPFGIDDLRRVLRTVQK